jgi:mitochondrial import inner membrane translocase subunit TIM50
LIVFKQSDSPIPPTYLEQKRREAQAQYREEQAYIAANKDNFDKLLKEEMEAYEKQMPSTFYGAIGTFLNGPPPPTQPGASTPAGGELKPAGSA